MKKLLFIPLILILFRTDAQENAIPYAQIPQHPKEVTAGNTLARFIDGLGYRYYWASEGLLQEDLKYKPSEEARSTEETIKHIYDLSKSILNAAKKRANVRGEDEELAYEQLREKTLQNFHEASQLFLRSENIADHKVVFQRDENKSEYPVWNLMNGQITDAIYHTGQLVSFRRASGNPVNSKVNVFIGKNRGE